MDPIIWLVIAAILIIVELITVSLTSVWFAGGAIAAAVCSMFTDNLWIQLIIFMAVSIVLWIFTRPIALKYLNLGKEKTNIESLAGQKAIVTETINNLESLGHAKINGLEWTARSVDNSVIEAGSTVIVKEISGVKLIVESLPQA